MTDSLPTIETLKDQARRLRKLLEKNGRSMGHSQALEAIAHQYGYKDWNTISARSSNAGPATPVYVGEAVTGTYLGQRFTGRVIGTRVLSAHDRFRVTLHFDSPVDVVSFDSFSAYRQRVTAVIDSRGTTPQKTSNGKPHLQLDL
ncbi:glyoxalase superfamily protein [Hoeflea prorocentri]|uniref:Glyoxalase superfamily protein n=1 Tax=Hoeflea prorocentri TaxID=1922333 RepID=A0A9X3UIP9_9HYPH|nr:glyoxalase superfamily protein [Hoeflea prorocentri]MCY6381155.1 glyoxalase superfamily protein [Hoeflea prorocentri]MDA5398955.1 glyoxalase superfamily protein [Hoeflea prorocentri]